MRKVLFLFFLLITYLIFRPVVANIWYPVHDTTSIARTYLLEKTVISGQVPAIWAGELDNGAGYPLFHFYAPAVTYLSLLGKAITGSYFHGIKLVLIITALTGMIGMYMLTRKWGRAAGLVASVAYALLPYAAVNLYVRGAYAEYLSMTLLPWVFYFWRDIKVQKNALVAALVTALFLLSHNLIPLMTAPFLLVWIFLNRPKQLKTLAYPALLTLALSAFYLIPLLFERGFVQADTVAVTTDYAKHFVSPKQLWNSSWGFGGSDLGVEDGMSFKVGKLQLVLASIAAAAILLKRRKKELFFVIAAIVAAFMTTPYSALLWQKIPYLPLVQFPWRFLVLTGFFSAILAGYALTLIKNTLLKSSVAILVVMLLIFLNLKLFAPQTIFPADLSVYTSREYIGTITSIVPEYRPSWVNADNAAPSNSIVLPNYYYPTWVVTVDGERVETYPSADGYLAFADPGHVANIKAVQRHTQLENVASLISLIALIIVLKLYVKA